MLLSDFSDNTFLNSFEKVGLMDSSDCVLGICFGYVLGMCWVYIGYVSGMFRVCFGYVLGTF